MLTCDIAGAIVAFVMTSELVALMLEAAQEQLSREVELDPFIWEDDEESE